MAPLAEFIRYLENDGLITFDIKGDGERRFSNRFRIQKYVFLAKEFGLDVPYKYDIYLYGPYSKALTREYYRLAGDPEEYGRASGILDGGFDVEGFRRAIDGRDNTWLEIAATLIDRSKVRRTSHRDLVHRVKFFKDPSEDYISGVLSDLEGMKLVKLSP